MVVTQINASTCTDIFPSVLNAPEVNALFETEEAHKQVKTKFRQNLACPIQEYVSVNAVTFAYTRPENSLVISESTRVDVNTTGNLAINGDNVVVFFDATMSQGRLNIGSITNNGKNNILVFSGGDYFIQKIVSKPDGKNHLRNIQLITLDDTRLFVNETIELRDNTIIINQDASSQTHERVRRFAQTKHFSHHRPNKKPGVLMIYAKGPISIDSQRSYEINALLFSNSEVTLTGGKKSVLNGAVTSLATINLYEEKAKGKRVKACPEIRYAQNIVEQMVADGAESGYCRGLPADPGEEGKKTLEGIDSNHDGLRDDLEVFIYRNYDDKPLLREIVKKQTIIEQNGLLMENKEDALTVLDEYIFLIDCGSKIRNEAGISRKEKDFIDAKYESLLTNTKERYRRWWQFNDFFGGQVIEGPSDKELEKCSEMGGW
jgi:hypothetical protein